MNAIWLVGFLVLAAVITAPLLLRGQLASQRALAFVTVMTCLVLSLATLGALAGVAGLIEAAIGLCLAQAVVAVAAMKIARYRSLQIALAPVLPRDQGGAL